MAQIEFIRDLVVIFGLSVVVVLAFHHLRLPSIVGFLISGALIGPYGLNLIDDVERVKVFAEIGVMLLLFTIGLEFSLSRLARIRRFVLIGGGLQVGLTIGAVALIAVTVFKLPVNAAIFWGFLASLSSTAIVLNILMARGELDAPHGRLSLAILIFQDIIVVPMMVLLPFLAGALGSGPVDIMTTLGRSVLFIGVILIAARWVIPKVLSVVVVTRSRELFVIAIILICAGMAWLSEQNGLSLALGAFIAGLAISESDYSHQALSDIMPFRDSFNSLFFVSIGMLLDVRFFIENMLLAIMLAAIILLLKSALVGGVTLLLGYPLRVAAMVGLSIPQVGEFSFILALASQKVGLLTGDSYQLFLVISILTMIVTPFLMQWSPRLASKAESMKHVPRWLMGRQRVERDPERLAHRDHVIIGGYGLNGHHLARVLKEAQIPYVILDLHPDAVQFGRSQGEPLFYGDVTQREVLRRMGVKQAKLLVLAVSDPFAVRRAVHVARQASPDIHIVVRTRYVRDVDDLLRLGADEVVPEEFETSLEIFDLVLQQYQVPNREISRMQREIRKEGYAKLRQEEVKAYAGHGELPVEVEAYYHLVPPSAPFVGHNLTELQLPGKTGVHVAALIRQGVTHANPDGAFQLRAGDTLVLIGTSEVIDKAVRYLEAPEPGPGRS